MGNPSQSFGASPAVRDHTMLPATQHRWTRPVITPARQAGTRFTYHRGMGGWVDFGFGYISRWFTCPQTVTRPNTNYLTETRPVVEPTTLRLQFQFKHPNRHTTRLVVHMFTCGWTMRQGLGASGCSCVDCKTNSSLLTTPEKLWNWSPRRTAACRSSLTGAEVFAYIQTAV